MRHEVDGATGRRGGVATRALAFTAPITPAARACGVRHAAGTAALVAACSVAPRVQSRLARTGPAAIALAAVAAAAQQHLRTATRTHEQAGGMVDQRAALLWIPPERTRCCPSGR